jgi:hypothetical protein
MCHTSMLAIMSEMVCCTGKQMTWEQVMKSPLSYAQPGYGWDVEPPIKPGPDGQYPAILPGVTELQWFPKRGCSGVFDKSLVGFKIDALFLPGSEWRASNFVDP